MNQVLLEDRAVAGARAVVNDEIIKATDMYNKVWAPLIHLAQRCKMNSKKLTTRITELVADPTCATNKAESTFVARLTDDHGLSRELKEFDVLAAQAIIHAVYSETPDQPETEIGNRSTELSNAYLANLYKKYVSEFAGGADSGYGAFLATLFSSGHVVGTKQITHFIGSLSQRVDTDSAVELYGRMKEGGKHSADDTDYKMDKRHSEHVEVLRTSIDDINDRTEVTCRYAVPLLRSSVDAIVASNPDKLQTVWDLLRNSGIVASEANVDSINAALRQFGDNASIEDVVSVRKKLLSIAADWGHFRDKDGELQDPLTIETAYELCVAKNNSRRFERAGLDALGDIGPVSPLSTMKSEREHVSSQTSKYAELMKTAVYVGKRYGVVMQGDDAVVRVYDVSGKAIDTVGVEESSEYLYPDIVELPDSDTRPNDRVFMVLAGTVFYSTEDRGVARDSLGPDSGYNGDDVGNILATNIIDNAGRFRDSLKRDITAIMTGDITPETLTGSRKMIYERAMDYMGSCGSPESMRSLPALTRAGALLTGNQDAGLHTEDVIKACGMIGHEAVVACRDIANKISQCAKSVRERDFLSDSLIGTISKSITRTGIDSIIDGISGPGMMVNALSAAVNRFGVMVGVKPDAADTDIIRKGGYDENAIGDAYMRYAEKLLSIDVGEYAGNKYHQEVFREYQELVRDVVDTVKSIDAIITRTGPDAFKTFIQCMSQESGDTEWLHNVSIAGAGIIGLAAMMYYPDMYNEELIQKMVTDADANELLAKNKAERMKLTDLERDMHGSKIGSGYTRESDLGGLGLDIDDAVDAYEVPDDANNVDATRKEHAVNRKLDIGLFDDTVKPETVSNAELLIASSSDAMDEISNETIAVGDYMLNCNLIGMCMRVIAAIGGVLESGDSSKASAVLNYLQNVVIPRYETEGNYAYVISDVVTAEDNIAKAIESGDSMKINTALLNVVVAMGTAIYDSVAECVTTPEEFIALIRGAEIESSVILDVLKCSFNLIGTKSGASDAGKARRQDLMDVLRDAYSRGSLSDSMVEFGVKSGKISHFNPASGSFAEYRKKLGDPAYKRVVTKGRTAKVTPVVHNALYQLMLNAIVDDGTNPANRDERDSSRMSSYTETYRIINSLERGKAVPFNVTRADQDGVPGKLPGVLVYFDHAGNIVEPTADGSAPDGADVKFTRAEICTALGIDTSCADSADKIISAVRSKYAHDDLRASRVQGGTLGSGIGKESKNYKNSVAAVMRAASDITIPFGTAIAFSHTNGIGHGTAASENFNSIARVNAYHGDKNRKVSNPDVISQYSDRVYEVMRELSDSDDELDRVAANKRLTELGAVTSDNNMVDRYYSLGTSDIRSNGERILYAMYGVNSAKSMLNTADKHVISALRGKPIELNEYELSLRDWCIENSSDAAKAEMRKKNGGAIITKMLDIAHAKLDDVLIETLISEVSDMPTGVARNTTERLGAYDNIRGTGAGYVTADDVRGDVNGLCRSGVISKSTDNMYKYATEDGKVIALAVPDLRTIIAMTRDALIRSGSSDAEPDDEDYIEAFDRATMAYINNSHAAIASEAEPRPSEVTTPVDTDAVADVNNA